jgi:hypothetical protein
MIDKIPLHLIDAAVEIGEWCESNNINDWIIGPVASRKEIETLKAKVQEQAEKITLLEQVEANLAELHNVALEQVDFWQKNRQELQEADDKVIQEQAAEIERIKNISDNYYALLVEENRQRDEAMQALKAQQVETVCECKNCMTAQVAMKDCEYTDYLRIDNNMSKEQQDAFWRGFKHGQDLLIDNPKNATTAAIKGSEK